MIFTVPELPGEYLQVIESVGNLRKELQWATSNSLNRWREGLARMAYARAIHGSNTIEGIKVDLNDAIAAVDQEESLTPQDENWRALVGYREAMDYVIQLAKDPNAYNYNEGAILGLHFMMMKYDLSKFPGRWRPGYIEVVNAGSGKVVYVGPDVALVRSLMAELFDFLNAKDGHNVIVKAAMAHLNLAMIHPFKDGNGRMARVLQTMVLAKEGILAPVFSSIEEYVGRNVQDYYNVLTEVGQGAWNPERNALPWIRFCLTAHHRQAMTLLRRVADMGRLTDALEAEIAKRKLPTRVMSALVDASLNLSVQNPTYRKQAEVTDQVAKKDLQSLVAQKLLVAKGERRWRHYIASDELKEIRVKTRTPELVQDPFEAVALRGVTPTRQQPLPGLEPRT
jgi:Fic family protein